MHNSTHPTPMTTHDQVVNQAIQELAITTGLERSVRRMTEVAQTIADSTKRLEEAGFGRLAAAVRAAAEGTMVGFLAPTDEPALVPQPTVRTLPAKRTRKSLPPKAAE